MDKKGISELIAFGKQFDIAIQSQNVSQIDDCIKQCLETVEKSEEVGSEKLKILYYHLGNLYTEKSQILKEDARGWQNNHVPTSAIESVNWFRKALDSPVFIDENSEIFYIEEEIKTNLANRLSFFHRTFEALELWSSVNAQKGDASFIAPLAKAEALTWVSQFINDPGHADYYLFESYKSAKSLLLKTDEIDHPQVKAILLTENYKERIKNGDYQFSQTPELSSLETKPNYNGDEFQYRKWCLDNTLFLNHLNDLTTSWVADQDILQFPDHATAIGYGPFCPAAFSAIKREFCFARFLAYEGIHEIHPSFENERLYLTDTLDYVEYSGHFEKLKTALRLAFSTFDSLYTLMLWYFTKKQTENSAFDGRCIKENFGHLDNPFITALYWLACDLKDNEKVAPNKWQAPNPDGKALRKIRNALEHKFIRIAESDSIWDRDSDFMEKVTPNRLIKLTLRTLKMARSGICYFVLAVKHHEETHSDKLGFTMGQTVPMYEFF
jgi:hypothetical protein